MPSFLITFKPATENVERGWPMEKYKALLARFQRDGRAVEHWRFRNKHAKRGDRVFLLLQGKHGPALIGYGTVAARVREGQAPVQFELLLDPHAETLAGRGDLNIEGALRYWRTQASGIVLPDAVANILEKFTDRLPAKNTQRHGNPDWVRDELIVALDFYLQHRESPPGKETAALSKLSRQLNALGKQLFLPDMRENTFRNTNGVYMKLMNFRRLDPRYSATGKVGLLRGSKADAEVWHEFADEPEHCAAVARAILSVLVKPEPASVWATDTEWIEEAVEGRLLTRIHIQRERDRDLVRTKIAKTQAGVGELKCEVCTFDFARKYGSHGAGFIECHHMRPLSTLIEISRTTLADLALLCSNCHRMIHRSRPWLSLQELRVLIQNPSRSGLVVHVDQSGSRNGQ